jgi:alkylation response protein AidB-like acyl-CoA dehydrogenase
VQLKLADMARRITLAQLLSLQLGRLKDAGTMQPAQVSLAKWNNVRMAIDIARECARHPRRRRHHHRALPDPARAEPRIA